MKSSPKILTYIKRVTIAVFSLLVVIYGLPALLSYIGGKKKSTVYVSVKAAKYSSRDTKLLMHFVKEAPPLYIIDSGNLYLLIRYTWNAFLYTAIDFEEWDSERIQTLLKKEELRKYFPDPDAPDGGVAWIPFPPRQKPKPE